MKVLCSNFKVSANKAARERSPCFAGRVPGRSTCWTAPVRQNDAGEEVRDRGHGAGGPLFGRKAPDRGGNRKRREGREGWQGAKAPFGLPHGDSKVPRL